MAELWQESSGQMKRDLMGESLCHPVTRVGRCPPGPSRQSKDSLLFHTREELKVEKDRFVQDSLDGWYLSSGSLSSLGL